ncbi:MAG: GatB/YqeY domain-containing protein [Bacilli bacterium]|nr:GatB/YqeY domain-containing protein [Bacilli bacterium]
MIIDELKKANIEALKNHDQEARASLSVAINRYMQVSIENKANKKETTDADTVRILTKLSKELDEEKAGYVAANRTEQAAAIDKQKAVILKFLPKMMSEDEIRKEIAALLDKSIPSVMRYFKEKHAGQCDMGLVSKIARGQ